MPYDIRLAKLLGGEMIIGKYDAEKDAITDVAALQTIPTEQGVQIMLLPYGYPFDAGFEGSISCTHVVYQYKNCPQDIKDKYLEATSNITISSGNLGLDLKGGGANLSDISSLLKK